MTQHTYQIAVKVIREQYAADGENPYRILENAMDDTFTASTVVSLMQTSARVALEEAERQSLARVKTAFHRLADRVSISDENEIRVPMSEILMYTPENRANIARMIRREADAL